MTRKILILGAGKIGGAIVDLLHGSGAYDISLADSNATFLKQAAGDRARTHEIDVSDRAALTKVAQGQDAVISALPFFLNPGVAQVCADVGAHYFDLTEDVETTRAVKAIAKTSKVAFAPQCGLAPGFISIVANQLTKGFDALREVHMRVGALPEFPANALGFILSAEAAAAFDDLTRSKEVDLLTEQGPGAWPNTFRTSRFIPAVEYIRAQRARKLLSRKMDDLMSKYDVFLASARGSASLPITNLTGHPAICLKSGFVDGLPQAVMITGRLYDEATLLRVALAYERATKWRTMHPDMKTL